MNQHQAVYIARTNKPAKGIKWEQYVALLKDRCTAGHLPITMKLNRKSLSFMLSRYPLVYVKPNVGAFGTGVMQVRKISNKKKKTHFLVHAGTQQKICRSLDEVYVFIVLNRAGSDYLVQQGIDLLRWHKRLFDLRMMISKQSDGSWRNEGFIGRVAKPNKIVTNIRSGGIPMSIDVLLAPYTNKNGKSILISRLNRLGSRICRQLEKTYPGIRLFGIDLGLDGSLKPWIIEVNTRPEKICWKCMRKLLQKNSRLRLVQ